MKFGARKVERDAENNALTELNGDKKKYRKIQKE